QAGSKYGRWHTCSAEPPSSRSRVLRRPFTLSAVGKRNIVGVLRSQQAVSRRPKRRCAMGIAISLQQYLDGRGVPYDVTTHERTLSASATARASSIPEDNLAKGVLMRREDGYLLAIVPASCHVELEALSKWLKQPIVLASETEASTIFGDCELGSVPPVAGAYDLMAVIDDRLE